jgi:hypothetical protein
VRCRLVALLVVVVAAGCSAGQDPGVTPSTDEGPTTTSRALAPCPAGGPDATTPAAGCLDADGAVVRPQP